MTFRAGHILYLFTLLITCMPGKAQLPGTKTEEVMVLAGAGTTFGGMGLMLGYRYEISRRKHLVPFAGYGIQPGNSKVRGVWTGYCFGVFGEWGKRHVFFFGPAYGTHTLAYDTEYPDSADSSKVVYSHKNLLIGPSLMAGYRGETDTGITWLLYGGVAHAVNNEADKISYYIRPALGIGLGYKFIW